MSSGQFINPPPFGTAGDYAGDFSFALDSTLKINWTGAPSLATLWLFKDGDAYNCTEFNLSKIYCAPILFKYLSARTGIGQPCALRSSALALVWLSPTPTMATSEMPTDACGDLSKYMGTCF